MSGYPREVVATLLTQCHGWEERERKLSQLLMVYYIISLSLLHGLNLRAVLAHLTTALRWLGPSLAGCLPTAAALIYRRAAVWHFGAAQTLSAALSAIGHSTNATSLPLRVTADGAG